MNKITNKNLISKKYDFKYVFNIEEINNKILNHPILLVEIIQKTIYWISLLINYRYIKQEFMVFKKRFKNSDKKIIIENKIENISVNSKIIENKVTPEEKKKVVSQYSFYMKEKDKKYFYNVFNMDKNISRNIEIDFIITEKSIFDKNHYNKIEIFFLTDKRAIKIRDFRRKFIND